MKPAQVAHSEQVGLLLHELLRQLDPAVWEDTTPTRAREQLSVLAALLAVSPQPPAEVHALVASHEPAADAGAWQAFRSEAEPVYGRLSDALRREGVRLPNLRPTNYLRNVQHMGAAVLILVLLHYVLPTPAWRVGAAGAALALAVVLETGRALFPSMNAVLMRMLGRIAHPHEAHGVNSSSWFVLSLFLLSFVDIAYGTVAIAILGAADPAAAVVGRRFGRHPLVNGRTVEGTLTFWVVGTLAAWGALSLWFDGSVSEHLLGAAAAALVGAVAELFSRRIDDNLAIPLGAALGLWLVS